MKIITTLTDRANLAALTAQDRLNSLTTDPEFGGGRNVDEGFHIGIGSAAAGVVGLAVAAFIAAKMTVLH
jgi:hypothetical protein